MLPDRPLGRPTSRSTARRAIALSALLVLSTLLAPIAAAPGATVAQAKKGAAKVPPGQLKKVVPVPARPPVAPPPPPALIEQTAKAVKPGKAPKTPKPEQGAQAQKPEKPQKAPKPVKSPTPTPPSKPRDPQPAEQPREQPSPSVPTPSPAPASAASAPAAAPPAQPSAQAQTPPRAAVASEQQRLGSADRRRGRRAPAEGGTPTRRPGQTGGDASVIADSISDEGPFAGTAGDLSPSAGSEDARSAPERDGSPVIRTVRDIVEVVPDSVKLALAALVALSLVLAGAYLFSALRVRSLARQRGELLSDVGLLQSALLPPVPGRVGALETSVAYRPADGLGAGGDFYDVLPLPGGRAGFILGDVSGHGRDALERTAFLRYTLRAYLEAGLEVGVALQVAGRVIGEGLGGDFATVLLAVHDPKRGSLTYASAGHPAPIVTGGAAFEPVLAGSSPPIGAGLRTGLRQTTVPLTPGVTVCLFTDGLIEARTEQGLLGRDRLTRIVAELGRDATAAAVIERVADEARSVSDDMAVCLLSPTATVTSGGFRTEQLELSAEEAAGPLPGRFLEECGVGSAASEDVERDLRDLAERYDGAVLHATFGSRRTVEVLPRNVESIEAASRRAVAV
ncbi:MAG TPA: PP2C family protein-serine/threonine phosphatase [Thermoleophilaceae bacterium]|nr:PP2C family protein-serine/threonine phosphatase [Thermoleophilaceae bacterium]